MTEDPASRRPGSEYGERPAGAPEEPPRGEGRPPSGQASDALDAHRDEVLRILARGEDMSAAALANVEATQVSALLTRLEHDGRVTRTATGSWRAEPATQATTEPQPSPREPQP